MWQKSKKLVRKHIQTSERSVKHPFASTNIQQSLMPKNTYLKAYLAKLSSDYKIKFDKIDLTASISTYLRFQMNQS